MDNSYKDALGFKQSQNSVLCKQNHNKNSKFIQNITNVAQNVLNIVGNILIILYLISKPSCMLREEVGRSHLTSVLLTGAGTSFLILGLFYSKLTISGGNRLGYLVCSLMLLNQKNELCLGSGDIFAMGPELRATEWQIRLQTIQGAAIITCLVQLFIGLINLNVLLTYIRPVTIAPTMIMLSIFAIKTTAIQMASSCWSLFFITCFVIFVTYVIGYHHRGSRFQEESNVNCLNIRDKLFFGIISVMIMWTLCAIFSSFELIWNESGARTDVYTGVLNYVPAFKFSYPFQWGKPNWKLDSILIMLPAAFVSILEILANYYNSSQIGVFQTIVTKKKDWNNCIRLEAIFCLLISILGLPFGININLNQNGQKISNLYTGVVLFLLGLSGTICALFTIIPEPIIAAVVFLIFLSVLYEGLNIIQCIDMKLTRNVFVFGISIFMGLIIPKFAENGFLKQFTGCEIIDDVLKCFISTEFLITALVAIFLDNIIRVFSVEDSGISSKNHKTKAESAEQHRLNEPSHFCDCISPFFA